MRHKSMMAVPAARTLDEALIARNAARDAQCRLGELICQGAALDSSDVYDLLLDLYAAGMRAGMTVPVGGAGEFTPSVP